MSEVSRHTKNMGWRSILALIPLAILLGALLSGCGIGAGSDTSGGAPEKQPRISGDTQSDKNKNPRASGNEESGKPGNALSATARDGQTRAQAAPRTNSDQSTVQTSTAAKRVEPFVASPRLSGGSGDRADSILDVRHGEHTGFQRVVVDLGVGSRPAQKVPEWTLTSPTGDGLLRISLPSVNSTKVTDGRLGDTLASNYYAVRAPEGGMFIDIFSRAAFIYRVVEVSDPARLVIDFKPSSENLDYPLPAENGNTVLVEPRAGSTASGPFVVSGYSRNPEAMNTIALKDSNGRVLLRDATRSNDWSKTWGYFETTVVPPQFSGGATLEVGSESPRDGSFSGVRVPVEGE